MMGTISGTKILYKLLKSKKNPGFCKNYRTLQDTNNTQFMIQRIQSLFLAVAAIAAILMFFFPIADFYSETLGNYKLLATGLKCLDPDPKIHPSALFAIPLLVFVLGSTGLSLITLFLYKNRQFQIRLLSFNILITIVLVIVIHADVRIYWRRILSADQPAFPDPREQVYPQGPKPCEISRQAQVKSPWNIQYFQVCHFLPADFKP